MELKDTVAIVTGGNGGLGRRICWALAEAGCQVVVVYAQSQGEADEVVAQLQATGAQAGAIQCDVADSTQVDRLAQVTLERFGRIDILVNDAAYNKWIPFHDLDGLTGGEWDKMLAINLTGPMMCIKAVAVTMKRQGQGRIVNISSVAGLFPGGSSIPYAVSKAGLIHLTRCMSVGLAPEILVNCIAPGYLEGTRATANLDPAYRERAASSSLLKRPADKDDIARQVIELCRTDSITGQTLVMDAGGFYH